MLHCVDSISITYSADCEGTLFFVMMHCVDSISITYSADCEGTQQETAAVSPADDPLDFAPTASASSSPSTALQYEKIEKLCKLAMIQ